MGTTLLDRLQQYLENEGANREVDRTELFDELTDQYADIVGWPPYPLWNVEQVEQFMTAANSGLDRLMEQPDTVLEQAHLDTELE